MRRMIGLLVAMALIATSPLRGDAAPKERTHASDEKFYAAVEDVAEQAFKECDKNHNHVLNQHEFANAEEALDAGLQQLGVQGVLGQPASKGKIAAVNRVAPSVPNAKKVSPEEFKAYAHAMSLQADEYFRQWRAMSAAQQKAYASRRGGRRW